MKNQNLVRKLLPPFNSVLALAALALTLAPTVWAATLTVTSLGDSGTGTLRGIVSSTLQAGDTIKFAANLSGGTITLTSGEVQLDQNVTIDASGLPGGISINGNHNSRIFEVFYNVSAVFNSLTLTNGYSTNGAAILNSGTLTANRCTMAGNTVYNGGGGGAIANGVGTVTLNQCTIAGNSTTGGGGGVGGGIFNLSGGSPVTLNQCTITGNSSGTGGGVDSIAFLGPVNVTLFNTIIAGNSANSGTDMSGTNPVLLGTNFIGGTPLLAPLGNYGGPTPTTPPLPGSPVVDAGADTATNAPYSFTTDQRGMSRRSGAHVDIGAVELHAPVVITTADSGPGSLRTAVSDYVESFVSVTFAASLSGQTILLTGGELLITNSMTIDGSALSGGINLSGGNASRVFNIEGGASVTMIGLTITKGNTSDAGGALYSAGGTSLHISGCTFTGSSGLEGGAILNDGTLLMENSTLSGNNAGYGGALQCRNLTSLIHCTIAGNSAGSGGGVFNKYSTLTLNNSIVAGNTSGGADADLYNQLATVVFTNANLVQSLILDRTTSSGSAPLTNAPLLAPLGNYGGPTQTMPPLPGSPAIDAGGPSTFTTDQRGLPRVVGPAPDLGAVEYQDASPVVTTTADSGVGSLRSAATYTTNGQVVTFASGLSGSNILLTSGQILLSQNLTIDASALPGGLQINGNHTSRLFYVQTNVVVVLNSLTLTNGFVAGTNGSAGTNYFSGNPGGIGQGGGIFNAGTLTLYHCTLSGNAVAGGTGGAGGSSGGGGGSGGASQGGGIYNSGTLTLSQSTLSGNSVAGGGGGSANLSQGGIGGDGLGGAVFNIGTLSLSQSALSSNSAVGGSGGAGGNGGGSSGGSGGAGYGGGIYWNGTNDLTLNQTTLAGNLAVGGIGGFSFSSSGSYASGGNAWGGGLYYSVTSYVGPTNLTLNQSTLTGDSAIGGKGGPNQQGGPSGSGGSGNGGGVYASGYGASCAITLNASTLANESAVGGNGGANTNANVGYGGSGGSAGGGGIVANNSKLILNQTTLAGDSAIGGAGGTGSTGGNGGNAQGGGILPYLTLNLNQSTVTGDSAAGGNGGIGSFTSGTAGSGQGGGIFANNAFQFSLFNSIVAGNAAPSGTNISGAVTTTTGFNLTNGAPLLAPLGYYGGPTPTVPPLQGSPAIDAGSDTATNSPYHFSTDQRGFPRRSGPHVDIGSVELIEDLLQSPPSITALSAVVIGTNLANGALIVQLSATVTPSNELSTAAYFLYGLTPYAATNGPLGLGNIYFPYHSTNAYTTVNLSPGFTYHWKALAANSAFTNSAPDQTFHLAPPGIPGDTNGDGIVDDNELNTVLSYYYLTSPWLNMVNVTGLGGTNVTFTLEGSPLGTYTVEYSTDLTGWFPLGMATPRYQFTDTNAPALPQRYYRLHWP